MFIDFVESTKYLWALDNVPKNGTSEGPALKSDTSIETDDTHLKKKPH